MGIEFGRDEIDKKKDELREKFRERGISYDPTRIMNADPKFHYRGVNKEARGHRVSAFQGKGYEIVPKDDPANWAAGLPGTTGGKEFGDQILMRIPREDYLAHVAEDELKLERQTDPRMEEAKERIDRIARNAHVTKAHTSIAINDSKVEKDLRGFVRKSE